MVFSLATTSDLLKIFAEVHTEWPHHRDLEQHVQLRLASEQHKHASWYVIKEEGQVRSSLGAYPMEIDYFGDKLQGIAIGAVHTSPAGRGRGLARQLIQNVHEAAKEKGLSFSLLSQTLNLSTMNAWVMKASLSSMAWYLRQHRMRRQDSISP